MTENPLRAMFPYFIQDSAMVYLDSAATTHKPRVVLDRIQQFYAQENANVHRSSHRLAASTTAEFETVRRLVKDFLGASSSDEIIWTKGATESINLVAHCLSQQHFKKGDEILISGLEHHANIVPWQQVAQRLDLVLRIMPVDTQGRLKLAESLSLINAKTALVAIGHVSNAMGNINPIERIIDKTKSVGALSLIDGAQAVSHISIDVQKLDCDFYVFSAHKVYGPTGTGVLYGKRALLEALPPFLFGGEMIAKVSYQSATFQVLPYKFEAGTPNIAGVLGLGAAIDFVVQHRKQIKLIESSLYLQLIEGLKTIDGIILWGEIEQSVAVQSFTVNGISQQDLSILLNQHNIALRGGHHCTMPLMAHLQIEGTLRVSLACYNTLDDIEQFLGALKTSVAKLKGIDTSTTVKLVPPDTARYPLADKIKLAKGWDQSYREIMLAGKGLKRLPTEYQIEANQVFGCESQVWLTCQLLGDRVVLEGESPSKIIRGLLAIIFEVLQDMSKQQIIDFELRDYLQQLGLSHHLSESRGNGMVAVVAKIKQFCVSH